MIFTIISLCVHQTHKILYYTFDVSIANSFYLYVQVLKYITLSFHMPCLICCWCRTECKILFIKYIKYSCSVSTLTLSACTYPHGGLLKPMMVVTHRNVSLREVHANTLRRIGAKSSSGSRAAESAGQIKNT